MCLGFANCTFEYVISFMSLIRPQKKNEFKENLLYPVIIVFFCLGVIYYSQEA